jgi:hypothetical protein
MEPNDGNRTINVVGIAGTGNDVRNIDRMNVTGARLTQGSSSSNLPKSVNVTGISGTNQKISNITDFNIVGVDHTQPLLPSNSPAESGPAPGPVERKVDEDIDVK